MLRSGGKTKGAPGTKAKAICHVPWLLVFPAVSEAGASPSAIEAEALEACRNRQVSYVFIAASCQVSVDCREAVADAEAWMSCLPSQATTLQVCSYLLNSLKHETGFVQVREDAELGVTFHSLCALHRCFQKAIVAAAVDHLHSSVPA